MEEITKIIKQAIDVACSYFNFKTWYGDDFDCDLYYENEEELLYFADDDLQIVVSDWVQSKADACTAKTCEIIGIDPQNIASNEQSLLAQRLVEEIYEMAKEALHEKLREQYFTERAYIHICSKEKEKLELMLNMTGKEIYDKYGLKRNQGFMWTAYFNDGLEADINIVFGEADETPCVFGTLICNRQEVFRNDYSDCFGTWKFEYQNKTYLVDFDNTMETWFNEIIDKCYGMLADEFYEIKRFGLAGDLKLLFRKDSDYNPDVDKNENNMVFIVTKRCIRTEVNRDIHVTEVPVDDSGNIHVSDLWNTLYRLWYGLEFSTL